MIAENSFLMVIASARDFYRIAKLFECKFKARSILATHAFDLVGIKRSWHSIEGGSVKICVENASYKQIPSMQ